MFTKTLSFIIFLVLCFSSASLAQRVDGPYTKIISEIPLKDVHPLPGKDHIFKCLSTKDDPLLIGAFHQFIIKTSLEKMVKIYENFEAYPDFLSTFKKTKVLQATKPNFLVSIEGVVPYFFLPNSHYDLWYDTKFSDPNTVIYTCQLSKSKDLVSLDGLTMIKKISDNEVSFSELDFVNAHWGIAKSLTPKMIWKDTIHGFFAGDYELKLKAESPDQSQKELKKEAQASVNSKEIENCIDQKIDAASVIKELY